MTIQKSANVVSLAATFNFPSVAIAYQEQALFQNKVQFWSNFVAAWIMFAVGLVPIAFLLMMPPQPALVRLLGFALSLFFELVSLCFRANLKQARKWAAENYDRAREDNELMQAIQMTDSIDDLSLRDKTRANLAKLITRRSGRSNEEPNKLDFLVGLRKSLRGGNPPTSA